MVTWFLFSWSRRLRNKCRFAASDVREDYSSTPIDIVADVKTEKACTPYLSTAEVSTISVFVRLSWFFLTVLKTVSLCLQIVVLGGSGFVGSAICKAAVSKGIEVVSLSRYLFSPCMMRQLADMEINSLCKLQSSHS